MFRQETELACSHLAGSGTQAYNSMSTSSQPGSCRPGPRPLSPASLRDGTGSQSSCAHGGSLKPCWKPSFPNSFGNSVPPATRVFLETHYSKHRAVLPQPVKPWSLSYPTTLGGSSPSAGTQGAWAGPGEEGWTQEKTSLTSPFPTQ